MEIQVNSTESLQYITYQVLGRGDVIVASTIQIPNAGQHTAVIRFLATYAMAPTAHVIVQFVKDDGEVVADAIDVELDGVLQNYVSTPPQYDFQILYYYIIVFIIVTSIYTLHTTYPFRSVFQRFRFRLTWM